ncbi:MAG: TetR/AcrR family transcriptional regulator [Christensenellaceae bacterium]
MRQEFQPKEIDIFKGIIGLIKQGKPPYALTAAEIAAAAGIGKGTLYEYFSSKDESIEKAVLYHIYESIEGVLRALETRKGFREKYYVLMELIEKNVASVPYFDLLNSVMQRHMKTVMCDKETLAELRSIASGVIRKLVEAGKEEGLFRAGGDTAYVYVAIYSALTGYTLLLLDKTATEMTDTDLLKEQSYTMLERALK